MDQNDTKLPPSNTAAKLATQHGVSEATVKRAAQAAERAAWQERENAKQEALAKAVAAIEAEFANA